MSAQASVIVVGAGIMGLSTAWALHRQGVKVTVYEQGAIPNPKGSSLDETRLIRHPYGPQPVYTAMVDDAFSAWGRLFADLATISKEPLYHQTGTLVMDTGSYDAEGNPVVETRRGQAWASASRACLKALGKEYTDLDGIGCARLVPGLDLEVLHDAFYVESGGVLSAGRIVELTAHYLASQGMSIHAHQRVTDIDPELGTVRLADGTTDQADQIVIAAGPWVTRLLPELASKVTPSRQFVVFAILTDDELRAWRQAPMLLDIDPEHGFYTVPPRTSTRLKIGDHRFSLTGDPDDDRDVAQDQAERVTMTQRSITHRKPGRFPPRPRVCFDGCDLGRPRH